MRGRLGTLLALSLAVILFTTTAPARETARGQVRFQRAISEGEFLSDIAELDPGLFARYASAAVDTYFIVGYDFEHLDWQGWTRLDDTEQRGIFFHADDFAGLDGGESGRLIPIEGSKSMWCGARPGTDDYMCSWATAPGYGNSWIQSLVCVVTSPPPIRLSYHGVFDSEPGYDFTYVEYANQGCCDLRTLDVWDGVVDTVVSHEIHYLCSGGTKLHFKFVSDGGWSDEDGSYQSDGACIIDSIVVEKENVFTDIEDFEDWEVGETQHAGSAWSASAGGYYGKYSGLWSGLEDRLDPCNDNFSTQIVFFVGSLYSTAMYPGLYVTPFCCFPLFPQDPSICQKERVVSPVIDLTKYSTGRDEFQDADIPSEDLSAIGGTILRYTIYQDLPLKNLVFPGWAMRNISETGCPGPWISNYIINYYWPDGYIWEMFEIGNLIDSDRIQVSLICHDMCTEWYGIYGDCIEHTPSPWYDNVKIQRYSLAGPQWSYRSLDLFQDNFPESEFDLDSWIRADAANDINPFDHPTIRPGDSIVVDCASPLAGGLREGGVNGDEEVYMHVRVTDIGPFGKPALFGSQLVGTYGDYVTDDGEWTIIQCPTALSGGINPVEGKYMADLNDSLLTRGYMIEYYFEAYDLDNERTTLPERADDEQYFEFTCLPTGKSVMLFVDDFHGRGSHEGVVELYFNQVFEAVMPPENQPDRYDVNSPSSLVSNGPGSRAKLNHMLWDSGQQKGYVGIIWDSGNLDFGTITDGISGDDKSNDAQLLVDWLDQAEYWPGLWISGDGIASELSASSSPEADELLSIWGGVQLNNESYFEMTGGRYAGGVVNPLVMGTADGIFGTSLQCYAHGGCPAINGFDVLEPTGYGVAALAYPDYDGSSYYAAIQSETMNSMSQYARVLWFGFSFMYIRDFEARSPIVRNVLFDVGKSWLGLGISNPDISEDETPKAYELSQNFPNPFNPVTTIRFGIREKGHVRLRIYNVAGQLVKTLVDEAMDAGTYTREWRGENNLGAKVSSGVYFYRLDAGEYENVKKMVLLR